MCFCENNIIQLLYIFNMGKLNKTFQRLRRENRKNYADISEKCKIPIERIEDLDNDGEFTNSELAAICDALGITISTFFKEADLTSMDSSYLIKTDITGNPAESELYEAICYIEKERMNNKFDSEQQGWKHNSFDEAVVVLENARNFLSSGGLIPPMYHREGYLAAVLNYLNDSAFIEGGDTVGYHRGRNYDFLDFVDPLREMEEREREDEFDIFSY